MKFEVYVARRLDRVMDRYMSEEPFVFPWWFWVTANDPHQHRAGSTALKVDDRTVAAYHWKVDDEVGTLEILFGVDLPQADAEQTSCSHHVLTVDSDEAIEYLLKCWHAEVERGLERSKYNDAIRSNDRRVLDKLARF